MEIKINRTNTENETNSIIDALRNRQSTEEIRKNNIRKSQKFSLENLLSDTEIESACMRGKQGFASLFKGESED